MDRAGGMDDRHNYYGEKPNSLANEANAPAIALCEQTNSGGRASVFSMPLAATVIPPRSVATRPEGEKRTRFRNQMSF